MSIPEPERATDWLERPLSGGSGRGCGISSSNSVHGDCGDCNECGDHDDYRKRKTEKKMEPGRNCWQFYPPNRGEKTGGHEGKLQ